MPQNKLEKCFDDGKRGGERHQGLRKITPSAENAQAHLAKALHNVKQTLHTGQQVDGISGKAKFVYTLHSTASQ